MTSRPGRWLVVLGVVLASVLPVFAQRSAQAPVETTTRFQGADRRVAFELSGLWAPRQYEEQFERGPGRELGDYLGIPVNNAARLRADAYKGSWLSQPEWQCRPMQGDSIWRGPSQVRFWNEFDPITRLVTAIHEEGSRSYDRPIWMDGRPHPAQAAPHDWNGFSTGEWNGDILTVTTTHVKEGYVERNGLPRSDLATYRQHFLRYGDWLTVVTMVYDPVYLTEPFVLSSEYELNLHGSMTPYPCTVVEEIGDRPRGAVPHWLPGTNPAAREFAERYHVPLEAARGGAETAYPEYRLRMKAAAANDTRGR
jgi:hypothetical protein